ncbi:ABC transporter permease subunit [Desulfoluna sp.]|uniref:ABC transporter permease n=1 Tax=Desulfoluna sp. TaxID=2045199 RepID=UPI002623952C|nr:ABC transporter permease subunit [Desulfoluna sp.]
MHLNKLFSIALNTYRESVRDKIFYTFFAFSIIIIGLSFYLGRLSIGESRKILLDVSFGTMSVIGTLVSVFVGISLVYREIERKTIYNILSKPIGRGEVVIGKFLGLSTALVLMEIQMFAMMVVLMFLQGHPININLFPAFFSILCEIELILAFAVIFSTMSSPILSGIFTIAFYIVGNISHSIYDLYRLSSESVGWVLQILYYVLPDFNKFNFRAHALYNIPIEVPHLFLSFCYVILYLTILLKFAIVVFEKKDLE